MSSKLLEALGIEHTVNNDQAVGECPLCGKEEHFYMSVEKGTWDCKSCGESGNQYTLIRGIYDMADYVTFQKGDSLRYVRNKGIKTATMVSWGMCLWNDTIYLPAYNGQLALVNLYRYVPTDNGKYRVLGLPELSAGFFTNYQDTTPPRECWITEGPWDGMRLSQETDLPIFAVPGASTFKESWLPLFKGAKVNLVYDNDHTRSHQGKEFHPGYDGMRRTARLLYELSNVTYYMTWDSPGKFNPQLADGYDICDHFKDGYSYEDLEDMLAEVEFETEELAAEAITPAKCESFDELLSIYQENYHVTDYFAYTLAISLSVFVSLRYGGENPLWFRILGPPGTGKSTIAEACSVHKGFAFPRSFVTGFHSGIGTGSKDASLIPMIKNKVIIIKDGDTLLRSMNRDQILAELRDIYDGTSRAHYRNKKQTVHEGINSGFLLCGTDDLRSLNRSSLGERFLDCEIFHEDSSDLPLVTRSIDNTLQGMKRSLGYEVEGEDNFVSLRIKRHTMGYIEWLMTARHPWPKIDTKHKKFIRQLAQALSYLRAKHDSEKDYRPRAELATRLGSQFTRLAVALCWVLNKSQVDEEVITIMKHVFHSSAKCYRKEVVTYLHDEGPTTAMDICLSLGVPKPVVSAQLKEMAMFRIVERVAPNGRKKRIQHWGLTDGFNNLWSSIHNGHFNASKKEKVK